MIKINRKPMPDEARARYETRVRDRGREWLAKHPEPQERPKDYWREVHLDIADAFHLRCAYTMTWLDHDGTIDHFVSLDEERSKAYEWDNFRYCSSWFNAKKQHKPAARLLDPLVVEDGWFELTIPDCQLRITDLCPRELREQAEFMLEKLELRNHPKLRRSRQAYWQLYEEEGANCLPLLDRFAPLVARAARKDLEQKSQNTAR